MLPDLHRTPLWSRLAVAVGIIAIFVLLLASLPAGPAQPTEPGPQSSARYLRNATGPTIDVNVPAAVAVAETDEPEDTGFRPEIDPRTFLTPYADSVLVDHAEWICDTPAPADAIHVAPNGSDDNPGTLDQPLASITRAVSRAQPGQNVLVRQGTYEESVVISGVSGQPDAWITLRSYPGERATLVGKLGQNSVALRKGSSYVNIACLTLAGPTEQPDAAPSSPSEMRDRRQAGAGFNDIPRNYGTGVDIGDRADSRNGLYSHHIRVIANEVRNYAEMGVSAVEANHITIAGNISYQNAKYSCHAGSGIGLGYMENVGGPDNPDGYSNYIVGNVSYGNENRSLQCFTDGLGAVLTDGNGIIIDLNNSTDYTGRTLVADNVVFGNGGRGILVFKSDNVDVVNNVSYQNAFTENLMGRSGGHPEIAVSGASDVRVYNNIAVPRDGNTAYTEASSEVDQRANLFSEPGNGGDLFAAPSTDPSADFAVAAEAVDSLTDGIPFLTTIDPVGEPQVLSPIGLGTIYTTGVPQP